jgi:hypothetical protein
MPDIETVGEKQVLKYFRVENVPNFRNEGKSLFRALFTTKQSWNILFECQKILKGFKTFSYEPPTSL